MFADSVEGNKSIERVLVTGVTGYVGGRLTPLLLDEGYTVRVLVRQGPDRLAGRPWSDDVEIAVGDVLVPETLAEVMADVDVAYYLIHSMSDHPEFRDRDIQAARNFGQAAAEAGVQRIIYLGGLGDADADLSEHLLSRQETGDALREAGVPVTEFRAAVIIGSGSISFEMMRHLTERIPIMICPKWVYTRIQPIAIRNVLQYMTAALTTPASAGEDYRNRRIRSTDLRRNDATVCKEPRPQALPGAGPFSDPASLVLLGSPGDADSIDDCATADQGTTQRSYRHQR